MPSQMQFGEFDEEFGIWDELDQIEEIERSVKELDPRQYWQKALEVVNIWAKYQSVKKLYINATHDETRHMVQRVVNDYYGGHVGRVHNHEQELSLAVDRLLGEFDTTCDSYRVERISRNWLYHKLVDAKDYDSYRRKCERRLNKAKAAVSLREI
ncbi:MAG: hypothetical protein K6G49_00355 [Candidatus Saccharibacteria bacterium]|nr:hypothetical protein [Candidatus Saccharibacteria bacterium]